MDTTVNATTRLTGAEKAARFAALVGQRVEFRVSYTTPWLPGVAHCADAYALTVTPTDQRYGCTFVMVTNPENVRPVHDVGDIGFGLV